MFLKESDFLYISYVSNKLKDESVDVLVITILSKDVDHS